MTDLPEDTVILDGAEGPDIRHLAAAGGTVRAYTCRAPDKLTENEDTVAVIPYGPSCAVLVVADGAGGLPAGKRASQTAVQALARALAAAMAETTLLRTAILNGIEAANEAVIALGNGSATTLTVITIEGLLARSYQVGDSEALITGQRGLIKLQTTPHSPTGFAVEAGFLDHREALHHEDRHLVSNFLGSVEMRIDVGASVKLRPRDTVLIASDGLMDNVHLDEIVELMRKGPLDRAMETIVAKARKRMCRLRPGMPSKPDDLSLVLFRKPYRLTS